MFREGELFSEFFERDDVFIGIKVIVIVFGLFIVMDYEVDFCFFYYFWVEVVGIYDF